MRTQMSLGICSFGLFTMSVHVCVFVQYRCGWMRSYIPCPEVARLLAVVHPRIDGHWLCAQRNSYSIGMWLRQHHQRWWWRTLDVSNFGRVRFAKKGGENCTIMLLQCWLSRYMDSGVYVPQWTFNYVRRKRKLTNFDIFVALTNIILWYIAFS